MKICCGRYLLHLLTVSHREQQWAPGGRKSYFWFCSLNVYLFSLLLKLCLLSSHFSKRQWFSAFKTLPQKVVGFLDKETGRKNLFHFKSLKIKILANNHCLLLVLLLFKLFQRIAVPVLGKRCVEVASSVGLWRARECQGRGWSWWMSPFSWGRWASSRRWDPDGENRWFAIQIAAVRLSGLQLLTDELVLMRVCVFCDREF